MELVDALSLLIRASIKTHDASRYPFQSRTTTRARVSSKRILPRESVIAANVPPGLTASFSPFLGESFKHVKGDALANDCEATRGFFEEVCSLRHIILENDASVEKVAGMTLERIIPTIDRLLSSESLKAEITASSPTVIAQK